MRAVTHSTLTDTFQGREGWPVDSADVESTISSTGSSLHSLEEANFLRVSSGSTSARFRPTSFLMMNSPTVPAFPPLSTALSGGNLKGDHMMFSGPEELLDFVTRYWQSDFVTLDLNTPPLLEKFMTRPFFTVVSVDAPLLMRYQRSLRYGSTLSHSGSAADHGVPRAASTEQSLRSFVLEHDEFYYGTTPTGKNDFTPARKALQTSTLHSLSRLVNMQVVNAFDTIESLRQYLEDLDLTNPERLRPSWDTYFMQLAALASLRSNCMKRRVGAILVRNKRILSTGYVGVSQTSSNCSHLPSLSVSYNGTPRGLTNCNEGGCTRCNTASETADECVCLHAEENALLEAGRDRVGDGSVLYCNTYVPVPKTPRK